MLLHKSQNGHELEHYIQLRFSSFNFTEKKSKQTTTPTPRKCKEQLIKKKLMLEMLTGQLCTDHDTIR